MVGTHFVNASGLPDSRQISTARDLAILSRALMTDFPQFYSYFSEKQFAGLFITHSVSEAVYLSTKVIVMSGRPGKIVGQFDVPFDMPRDPEIRFTPEFAALVGEVSLALREAHS